MALVVSVLGLAAACGGWVLLQRWIARHDPEAPGVEGRCGSCAAPPTDPCSSETRP